VTSGRIPRNSLLTFEGINAGSDTLMFDSSDDMSKMAMTGVIQ